MPVHACVFYDHIDDPDSLRKGDVPDAGRRSGNLGGVVRGREQVGELDCGERNLGCDLFGIAYFHRHYFESDTEDRMRRHPVGLAVNC